MKASELIEDLKTLIEERGDLDVVNEDNDLALIEFSKGEDGNDDAFVVS